MIPSPKFGLRFIAGGILQLRMRLRSSPWPARGNRVTLVFEPHQDDGALGCGGLIARRAAQGEAIHIAYITDGSRSHPNHPLLSPSMVASLRADEARAASALLGVSPGQLAFLGAPDGGLPHLTPETRTSLVKRICDLIECVAPSEVLITSRFDGSSEHEAACELVAEALGLLSGPKPRLLEYIVWSRWSPRLLAAALRIPSRIYRHALSPSERAKKQAALRAYRSQFDPVAPWTSPVLPKGFARMFRSNAEYFFEFQNS